MLIGFEQSQDLKTWTPLTTFSPSYDPVGGTITIDIAPDASSPQFYRVLGTRP